MRKPKFISFCSSFGFLANLTGHKNTIWQMRTLHRQNIFKYQGHLSWLYRFNLQRQPHVPCIFPYYFCVFYSLLKTTAGIPYICRISKLFDNSFPTGKLWNLINVRFFFWFTLNRKREKKRNDIKQVQKKKGNR